MKNIRLILLAALTILSASACKSKYQTLLQGNNDDAKYAAAFQYFNQGKYDKAISKAIACETGMQNGGLAVTLARNNFPAYMPMICLPSVFCSIMQSAIGGVLASIWRITSSDKSDKREER